jgi:hypothetical protein
LAARSPANVLVIQVYRLQVKIAQASVSQGLFHMLEKIVFLRVKQRAVIIH